MPRTKGQVIVDAIILLEEALERDLPILNMTEVALCSAYIETGAAHSPFFIVCNKDEMADQLKLRVKERKEWMQSLFAVGKGPESEK